MSDLEAAAPALGEPAPARVFANRGLAGIDGTTATAIGVSLSGYYAAFAQNLGKEAEALC